MSEIATTTKSSPLVSMGQRFNIEPDKLLGVLRGTVIKPDKSGKQATNEEVAAFCIVAQQYGLNPFTREIHAFASGDKGIVPIVGIDGWAHIVNSSPQFDGCEFEEEGDEQGRPVKVTCRMFVKGRTHPVSVPERYAECKRNTIPWTSMPWRMLRHKAFMQAARIAFGLSGIYDDDEARDIVGQVPETTSPPVSLADKIKKATAKNGTANGTTKKPEPTIEDDGEIPNDVADADFEEQPPQQPQEPHAEPEPQTDEAEHKALVAQLANALTAAKLDQKTITAPCGKKRLTELSKSQLEWGLAEVEKRTKKAAPVEREPGEEG